MATFKIQIQIPKRVRLGDQSIDRDVFMQWIWERFGEDGLVGVHEGTLLTEEAAREGLETESWTVDAAEAPRERDWIENQKILTAEMYFSGREEADLAARELGSNTDAEVGAVEEVEDQDWDAQWKASFLGSVDGVPVAPNWRILPPWVDKKFPGEKILKINPGAGFGTGTHPTTQLCLQALAEISAKRPFVDRPVLDFGSGSGILSIGAAILGARVDGIEIDPLAIDNAVDNARLNSMESRIHFDRTLAGASSEPYYEIVIANILRPVLLEFASRLVDRLAPGGSVILSGLIESDVPEVQETYSALLAKKGLPFHCEVRALEEWRSIVWRPV